MKSRCAINKSKPIYEIPSVISKFGRFAAEANSVYQEFQIVESAANVETDKLSLLYKNTNAFSKLFINNVESINLEEYPLIRQKLEDNNSISTIETNTVIELSVALTPNNFIDTLYVRYNQTDRPDEVASSHTIVLDAYEEYLNNGGYTKSKMGTFCSLVPNIFSGIKEFSNFYDNISAISGTLNNIILNIDNLSASSLLKGLEDKILDTIDDIAKSKIDQLSDFKFSSAINLNTISIALREQIYAKGLRIKEDLTDLFSNENVTQIKKNISGLISYAISIFEKRDIEEIEFVVYRFCNLIQMFEQDANNSMMKLKNWADSIDYAQNTISASSKAATARAIQAGALRFDSTRYSEASQQEMTRQNFLASNRSIYYDRPISAEDVDGITSWNGGKGDEKIGFAGQWTSILGRLGWDGVVVEAKVKLMRVQERFGKRLVVNSGFRPQAYNASIGGARGSKHCAGTALDITWDGFTSSKTERDRFVQICREEGFKGFGINYQTFRHIDLGPERVW